MAGGKAGFSRHTRAKPQPPQSDNGSIVLDLPVQKIDVSEHSQNGY
jgi:hypothetical protein